MSESVEPDSGAAASSNRQARSVDGPSRSATGLPGTAGVVQRSLGRAYRSLRGARRDPVIESALGDTPSERAPGPDPGPIARHAAPSGRQPLPADQAIVLPAAAELDSIAPAGISRADKAPGSGLPRPSAGEAVVDRSNEPSGRTDWPEPDRTGGAAESQATPVVSDRTADTSADEASTGIVSHGLSPQPIHPTLASRSPAPEGPQHPEDGLADSETGQLPAPLARPSETTSRPPIPVDRYQEPVASRTDAINRRSPETTKRVAGHVSETSTPRDQTQRTAEQRFEPVPVAEPASGLEWSEPARSVPEPERPDVTPSATPPRVNTPGLVGLQPPAASKIGPLQRSVVEQSSAPTHFEPARSQLPDPQVGNRGQPRSARPGIQLPIERSRIEAPIAGPNDPPSSIDSASPLDPSLDLIGEIDRSVDQPLDQSLVDGGPQAHQSPATSSVDTGPSQGADSPSPAKAEIDRREELVDEVYRRIARRLRMDMHLEHERISAVGGSW